MYDTQDIIRAAQTILSTWTASSGPRRRTSDSTHHRAQRLGGLGGQG